MKGDFTRFTFQPQKHYNSVWMQQGRLQLDADWNEMINIQNYLRQSQSQDMIGGYGVSKTTGGFQITPDGKDLRISPGHVYVNGILCELEKEVKYTQQDDHPSAIVSDIGGLKKAAYYLAYLDVWQRHITAVDDPNIQEVALGGLDTSTRSKTIWQVRLLEIGLEKPSADKKPGDLLQQKLERANPEKRQVYLNVSGKYTGSENFLYRVEIHQPGALGTATFKWSRNNATLVRTIAKIVAKTITLNSTGSESTQSFEAGQWVEIIDEVQELNNQPGRLVQLQSVSGNKLEILGDPLDAALAQQKLKIRGWDNKNSEIATLADEWEIEQGIKIKFASENNSLFQTGDYWLIPVRNTSNSNTNNIEWLDSQQLPLGIKHDYFPLVLLQFNEKEEFSQTQEYTQKFPPLIRCLDKTGDTMTGNLYIAGKYEQGQYIPAKLGIGTLTPLARLQVENTFDLANIASFLDSKKQTQLIITETGQIGIGIDIPHEKLHLNGAIRGNQSGALRINTGTGYVDIGSQDPNWTHFRTDRDRYLFDKGITIATGLIGSDANTNLSLQTHGVTQMTLLHSNGNVGIGIDIPQEKLHLNGAIRGNQSGALRINTGTGYVDIGSQDPNWTHFRTDRDRYLFDKGITIATGLIGSDANTNLSLQTHGVTQMTLLHSNGNVGIGIDTPQEKLHVAGTVRISNNTDFVNIAPQNNNRIYFQTNLDSYHFDQAITLNTGVISSENNLSFKTANATRIIVLNNNGNVGIDVDKPTARLHVQGAKYIQGQGKIKSDNTRVNGYQTAFLQQLNIGDNITINNNQTRTITAITNDETLTINAPFDNDLSDQTNFIYQQPITHLVDSNGTTQLIVTATGNVGIGTSGDDLKTKLHVEGNIRINGDLYQNSSRELKNNISEISSQEVAETLSSLKPIKYSYKNDPTQAQHLGFIAEDVPDLIASTDKKMVRHLDIIAVLTQAIKIQQATITVLNKKLENQQIQIARLTDKVQNLEKS